jgi:hypothetical protein
VKCLVRKNGLNLEFASNRLKDDQDIVENSSKYFNKNSGFKFASERLKYNQNICLKAI